MGRLDQCPTGRQKVLLLWSSDSDLRSPVVAWARYGPEDLDLAWVLRHQAGSQSDAPFDSVVQALSAGWQLAQLATLPQFLPGAELCVGHLPYEAVLVDPTGDALEVQDDRRAGSALTSSEVGYEQAGGGLLEHPEHLARFCTQGFLVARDAVPDEINQAVLEDLRGFGGDKNRFWEFSASVRAALASAGLARAYRLLLGPDMSYDHSSVHKVPAGFAFAQAWHQDSLIEVRPMAFDLLVFYFPADTPLESGPTLVLPGSHLRRVSNRSLARYQNFKGQRHLACRAGTVVLAHAGLWHCGQPNISSEDRYMFKLRLRGGVSQAEAASELAVASHEVRQVFRRSEQPWQGTEAGVEQVGYARLWRYLGGLEDLAPEGYLTRTSLDDGVVLKPLIDSQHQANFDPK